MDQKLVKVRSVTCVAEFKGDKREHACSVKFEYRTDNSILDVFDKSMLRAFYEKDSGKAKVSDDGQGELSLPRADVALTARKLLGISMPLKFKKDLPGYELVYHCGASDASKIKLIEVMLSDFQLDLQEGGGVLVIFSAYSKPGADVQGRIDHMAQTEIEVSLTPPSEKQPDLADKASKPAKKTAAEKAGGADDPFAGSDLAQGAEHGPQDDADPTDGDPQPADATE
ncbi:hypothetical protein XF14_16400 [Burkholderia gladioli]|nr:hypothetical protein XF14_16400 [Burkholderia gladioli]